MPSLTIDRIVGLDAKTSETDLDLTYATILKNLSTTKRPGALEKSGAYADVSDSLVGTLPSVTPKSIKELGLTLPSNKDIYLLYALSGSDRRLYYGDSWDGSSFNASWIELTEREGEYTAGASTSADQIQVNSGDSDYSNLSSVADYYNGMVVVVDITASERTAAIITDYTVTAGAKIIFVTTGALNGAASGDTFSIARSNLLAEGIGESSSGSPPRYGNLTTVDDVIRWAAKENSAIGMTGNTSQYPTQYNLWFGYINRAFGTTGATETFDDFWLTTQQMLAPYILNSNNAPVDPQASAATGTLENGKQYAFYAAYIYDGVQIGPLSLRKTILVSSAGHKIDVDLRIPYNACYESASGEFPIAHSNADNGGNYNHGLPTYYSPYLIDRRCTGVRIYVSKFSVAGVYEFGTETDPLFWTEQTFGAANAADNDLSLTAEGLLTATVTLSDDSDFSGNDAYSTDIGQSNLHANFKYGTSVSQHFIAAAIRTSTGQVQNNDLVASVVDGAGSLATDYFGASNVINLGFFGSKEITGVHVLGDEAVDQSPKARFLVFTDDDYYVLQITSGSSFSHTLDTIGEKEGLFAPDSLTYAEKALFGVSRNGFRIYNPNGTKIIGEGLKNAFDALTDPSECLGGYLKSERLVIFHFATDSKTYAVDLLSENLNMFEYEFADTFVWLAPLRNGGLLGLDATKIYQFDSGTDQDGTAITPIVRSKRFDARHFKGELGDEIILTEGIISYQSDTAITFNLYKDNSASPITFNALSLAAKTTEGEQRFLFPMGTRAREMEAEVTLTTTQASTNTDFRFNGLRLFGYTKRRLS